MFSKNLLSKYFKVYKFYDIMELIKLNLYEKF